MNAPHLVRNNRSRSHRRDSENEQKGPDGVPFAQGQDLTFNLIMAGGVRYNFDPRYSVSAGIAYMCTYQMPICLNRRFRIMA